MPQKEFSNMHACMKGVSSSKCIETVI